MKSPRRTIVEAVVLALALVAPVFAAASGLDVEIAIAPSTTTGSVYRCDATLRDQATGETLAAPSVIFRRGEDATVSAELANGQAIRLAVAVSASGDSATYRAELLDGGKIVSSQRATVRLRGAE